MTTAMETLAAEARAALPRLAGPVLLLALGCTQPSEPGQDDAESTSTSGPPPGSTSGETGDAPGEDVGSPVDCTSLEERVSATRLESDLRKIYDLGASTGGTRTLGSLGYELSVAHLQSELAGLGYEVELHRFEYDPWFVPDDPPRLTEVSPGSMQYEEGLDMDFLAASDAAGGDLTARVQAVGSETAGACSQADFSSFVPGRIALSRRGPCDLGRQVRLAEQAGAAAVLVYNDVDGTFVSATGTAPTPVEVPVLLLDASVGEAFRARSMAMDISLHIYVNTHAITRVGTNVVATSAGSDDADVIMVGAHLDSVLDSAGANDNASGSALVMELARLFDGCTDARRVRFAWWDGEEQGLLGSRAYLDHLSDSERDRIQAYFNYDMVASPNHVFGVLDGDGSVSLESGPGESGAIESHFHAYFSALGLATRDYELAGRSDELAFVERDIPIGGMTAGFGELKTQDEVDDFGGQAGVPYDVCYHESCDQPDHVRLDVLEQITRAAVNALAWYALR